MLIVALLGAFTFTTVVATTPVFAQGNTPAATTPKAKKEKKLKNDIKKDAKDLKKDEKNPKKNAKDIKQDKKDMKKDMKQAKKAKKAGK